MLASLELETVQDTPVARLSGEVDATNARDLGSRLLDSVPNSAMGLVLDLSRTSYLDSSGVQLLFELADRLRRRQQQLHLVVPDESFIGDVLEAVNLGGVARANATVLQALEALRAAHP
jgi:anti-anti-sigma factor